MPKNFRPMPALGHDAGVRLARLLASVFGTGRWPASPGTAGSAVALIAGWPILLWSHWLLAAAALAVTAAGWWAIQAAGAEDDPGWVVIDEVAGMWLGMLGLAAPPTVVGLLLAFLLFRLMDILKPGPIGWADRRHGATGVMLDDVIAGVATAGILAAMRLAWPELPF